MVFQRNIFTILVLIQTVYCFSQKAEFRPAELDLGNISEAGSIRFNSSIANTGNRQLVILRADAQRGTDVFISKKSLNPGDTALITFIYHPLTTGVFRQTVSFVTNVETLSFSFSGSVNRLLTDNMLNCVDFKPKNVGGIAEIPFLTKHKAFLSDAISGASIDRAEITYVAKNGEVQTVQMITKNGFIEHNISVGYYALVVKAEGYDPLMVEQYISSRSTSQNFMLTPSKTRNQPIPPANAGSPKRSDSLDFLQFKPNNLVFLIDASGSMKDANKLPLLKKSMQRLIKSLRSSDNVSLIVYADKVSVLVNGLAGNQKELITDALEQLKAEGVTAGSAGLDEAYRIAERMYIQDGNNQIVLATDGVFRLSAASRKNVELKAGSLDKPILLSIVAMGDDEAALNMLQKLSFVGKGSYLHIIEDSPREIDALLNEISEQSRR